MIKAAVFLALLGVVIVANGQICNKVTCGTLTDKCASFENKVWTLQSCSTTQYCEITNANLRDTTATATGTCKAYTKPTVTAKKQLPGAGCSSGDGCYSGSCSSNICQGLAKGKECVARPAVGTDPAAANEKKFCGANVYCDTTADPKVCADGSTTDCSTTKPCAFPKSCIGGTCTDLGTVANGSDCVTNFDCVDGSFCDTGKCAAAVAFTKGSFHSKCLADADCAGGITKCDCITVPLNINGNGWCSGVSNSYSSDTILKEEQKQQKTLTSTNCPLLANTPICYKTYQATAPTFTRGDCYKTFRYGGTNDAAIMLYTAPPQTDNDKDNTGGGSSSKIVASLVGFFAYFLF